MRVVGRAPPSRNGCMVERARANSRASMAARAMPEGLRAEGLRAKGLADEAARQLTYVGPSEDGDAEIQQHDAAAPGAVSRKDRRQAKRQESKERKLLRRG